MTWTGKNVKIAFEMPNKKTMFYSATIVDETKDHITFIDKFGKQYEFPRKTLRWIREVDSDFEAKN